MTVITIGNFKGGVGKTTVSTMFSYIASEHYDKKVLLVDFDPQGNASEIMKRTFPNHSHNKMTLLEALKTDNINNCKINLSENLDLLPAEPSLANLSDEIAKKNIQTKRYILKRVLDTIKEQYDLILIDVPPTINSDFTNNAVYASDFIVMVFQTQQSAYESSLAFVNFLRDRKKESNLSFDLIGSIPVLIKKNGLIDTQIIEKAKKTFGAALFEKQIYQRERIKKFGAEGIKNEDLHDKMVMKMFNDIYLELFERLSEINSKG